MSFQLKTLPLQRSISSPVLDLSNSLLRCALRSVPDFPDDGEGNEAKYEANEGTDKEEAKLYARGPIY
jgi:hypothetical protein